MSKRQSRQHHPSQPAQPKRHRLRQLVGLGVVGSAAAVGATVAGVWGGWHYMKAQAQHRRDHTAGFNKLVTANTYHGLIHKDGDELTLTTAGGSYHVLDPLAIIDKIAKARLASADKEKVAHKPQVSRYDNLDRPNRYYDLPVSIMAEVSQKGRYGHLGRFDYQLTVVEAADKADAV